MSTLWLAFMLAAVPADNDKPAETLAAVKRIYVDRLTGGESAAQIRDLLISSLEASKLFVITENEQRADAILRGAAEDLIFTDKYNSSESVGLRTGNVSGRNATRGVGLTDHESTHIEERKHEALAAVRLVNKDGDVIWATTQESTGAKFRGASADVADKVTKQLAADYQRARNQRRLP